MYFGLTKEEEATQELRELINHERVELMGYDHSEVNIAKFHTHPDKSNRDNEVSIILGDMFDEHAGTRCHHISDNLFNGKYEPKIAILIKQAIIKRHVKKDCEKCQRGRKFMVPSLDTIIKNYEIVSKGGRLSKERNTW